LKVLDNSIAITQQNLKKNNNLMTSDFSSLVNLEDLISRGRNMNQNQIIGMLSLLAATIRSNLENLRIPSNDIIDSLLSRVKWHPTKFMKV
jgi:hypothetical protein